MDCNVFVPRYWDLHESKCVEPTHFPPLLGVTVLFSSYSPCWLRTDLTTSLISANSTQVHFISNFQSSFLHFPPPLFIWTLFFVAQPMPIISSVCINVYLHVPRYYLGWDPKSIISHHTNSVSSWNLSFVLSRISGIIQYVQKHNTVHCCFSFNLTLCSVQVAIFLVRPSIIEHSYLKFAIKNK